jgi:hypothetical protein
MWKVRDDVSKQRTTRTQNAIKPTERVNPKTQLGSFIPSRLEDSRMHDVMLFFSTIAQNILGMM